MLVRVDHIDLKVPDLEAAVEFFTSVGLRVVRRMAERGSVELALPGENQVLFEVRHDPTVESTKIDHVAFAVDDPAASINQIKAAGGTFSRERHPTHTGRTVSNFLDPHGGKWQLVE
ncbi:VOC family protein [Micromonospora sp. NPDC092111]|uniref:VOC family protein n=1 Tax=Micromonospora sp. NPDC092111 TaxID=3364289 RepID=UPI003819E94D